MLICRVDCNYCGYASELSVMFSLKEQINIASWHIRSLTTYSDFYSDATPTFAFGKLYSSFPSQESFTQLLNTFLQGGIPKQNLISKSNEVVDMALAYGFPLAFPEELKSQFCESNGSLYTLLNPFLTDPSVIRGVLEFLEDPNNASSHSVFDASTKVTNLIRFYNSSLTTLSIAQLSEQPTAHILRYIRSHCSVNVPVDISNRVVHDFVNMDDERLWAFLDGKSEEEVKRIFQALISSSPRYMVQLQNVEEKFKAMRSSPPSSSNNTIPNIAPTTPSSSTPSLGSSSASTTTSPSTPGPLSGNQAPSPSPRTSASSSASSEEETGPNRENSDIKESTDTTPSKQEKNESEKSNNDGSSTSHPTVSEEESGLSPILVILALLLVVIGVVFFLKRGQKKRSTIQVP